MTKLGLQKDRVKLFNQDKDWVKLAEKELNIINSIFKNKAFSEHIGSTAIPGIKTKPIVDILVGVISLKDLNNSSKKLQDLGWFLLRKVPNKNNYLIFAKGDSKMGTTHYLHLVKYKGILWNKKIIFRDKLNSDKNLAKKYENLKIKLANKFSDNRMAYIKGKKDFVEKVVSKK